MCAWVRSELFFSWRYTADILNWTARAVERIHAQGMLVIPNFSGMSLTDENILLAANLTDGMLAEGKKGEGHATTNYMHVPCTFLCCCTDAVGGNVLQAVFIFRTIFNIHAMLPFSFHLHHSNFPAGFAEWNPVPNTSAFETPPPMTTPSKFKLQVRVLACPSFESRTIAVLAGPEMNSEATHTPGFRKPLRCSFFC